MKPVDRASGSVTGIFSLLAKLTDVVPWSLLLSLLVLTFSGQTAAHTLGIDKADLRELPDGSYHLVSHVPPRYQSAITAPRLPKRCELQGSPRGARGPYEVRFIFSCEQRLNADDLIELPWQREGAMMTVHWQEMAPITRFAAREDEVIRLDLADYQAGSGSWVDGARRYTMLGIEHILVGIDHLLFVLALLLVVGGGWRLVQTVTAFTVAHSITLGLATLGYLQLPSAPVEAAIALSIVFLCVEIVHHQRGHRDSLTYRMPWLVAFAFGLLHGLGFAGALSEIGLPPPEIPLALLFFNIGVELGQLLFVFAVLATLRVLSRGPGDERNPVRYRSAEVALVYAIGITASYWLIERSLDIFMPVS